MWVYAATEALLQTLDIPVSEQPPDPEKLVLRTVY
jgi:hypothetical protein